MSVARSYEDKNSFEIRRQRTRELKKYYKLEKRLSHSARLDELWRYSEIFSETDTAFYHSQAGWTLAEAALIGAELPRDDRHGLLTMAEWEWQKAHDIQSGKEEREKKYAYRHFLKSPELLKVESSQAILPVFSAMIDGDVTHETRDAYYENQLELAVKASEGASAFTDDDGWTNREADGYIGVAHEINAMLSVNRIKSPTLMGFPALARSDSGIAYPRQTHDLMFFDMHWGEIMKMVAVEVKTTPKDEHFDRYEAMIVGGTVHLNPNSERDPALLTELLVKEHKHIASPEEITELDHITDKIIHVARHGFSGTEQCRDIAQCQEVPSARTDRHAFA